MRLFQVRRYVDRRECNAIIRAVAALSSMSLIAWRVSDEAPDRPLAALAENLLRARRAGLTFELPAHSRHWFDLRYECPDAGYALALVFVWSFAATRTQGGGGAPSGDHVLVAMWHLRQFLPVSSVKTLSAIEGAFRRHCQSTAVGSTVPQ